MDVLEISKFEEIQIVDPFFDSLKGDYKDFSEWFARKKAEEAYVQRTDGMLTGFMYLKLEEGAVSDVSPIMTPARRIKIGTLKVEAHGTRLGERLVKKAFDRAVVENAEEIYITVFPKHESLINLLLEFGFVPAGQKLSIDGTETVFLKSLDKDKLVGDIRKDYPLINAKKARFYMLGIYPKWHSQLFPDSILKSENYDLISDISHTNSISKTYVCWMAGVGNIDRGDVLVIYRTKEGDKSAEYSSVATSACTVEEVRGRSSFSSAEEYIAYAEPFSVFNSGDLRTWWKNPNLVTIRVLYNAAFTKRVIRKTLMDVVGLDRNAYAGFMELSQAQFLHIAKLGGLSDRLIVH